MFNLKKFIKEGEKINKHVLKHKTKLCKRRFATSKCFNNYASCIGDFANTSQCNLAYKCARRCKKYHAHKLFKNLNI